MTRLQAFAERVTREMLEAYDGTYDFSEAAARRVLEREVRAFVLDDCNCPELADWLDEEASK